MESIHHIFLMEENKKDKSFFDKGGFLSALFEKKYSQSEAREIHLKAKEIGFELGFNYANTFTRIIELGTKAITPNHKLFYERFVRLCNEHNVSINYHSDRGMFFSELSPKLPTNGHSGIVYAERNSDGFTVIIESSKTLLEKGIDELFFRKDFENRAKENTNLFIYQLTHEHNQ